jgi:hypothetical protein
MQLDKDTEGSCVKYWMVKPVLVVLAMAALLAGTKLFNLGNSIHSDAPWSQFPRKYAGVAAAVNMPWQRISDFAAASKRSGHSALRKAKLLTGADCYDASLTVCASISTLSFRRTALKMVDRLSMLGFPLEESIR